MSDKDKSSDSDSNHSHSNASDGGESDSDIEEKGNEEPATAKYQLGEAFTKFIMEDVLPEYMDMTGRYKEHVEGCVGYVVLELKRYAKRLEKLGIILDGKVRENKKELNAYFRKHREYRKDDPRNWAEKVSKSVEECMVKIYICSPFIYTTDAVMEVIEESGNDVTKDFIKCLADDGEVDLTILFKQDE
jgi:hypothetical protein